eukprot:EG_transcript_26696
MYGRGSAILIYLLALLSSCNVNGVPSFCKAPWTVREAKIVNRPLMVYVGSADVRQPGFLSFPQEELDVTVDAHYAAWFCPGSVDVFLTEHTFEHIPLELHVPSFRLMLKYLKPGGFLRLAIPTFPPGYSPTRVDRKFRHVAFPTTEQMVATLRQAGFSEVRVLETGIFRRTAMVGVDTGVYDSCAGRIRRSVKHDARNELWLRKNYLGLNLTEHNDVGANRIRGTGLDLP